jgi:hypothetical protein
MSTNSGDIVKDMGMPLGENKGFKEKIDDISNISEKLEEVLIPENNLVAIDINSGEGDEVHLGASEQIILEQS